MARVQAAALCCLPQANRHWRARPLHLGPVLCCRAYHLSTASAGQPCRHLPSLAIPEGTTPMAMDVGASPAKIWVAPDNFAWSTDLLAIYPIGQRYLGLG
jgi:hypothetical protein